MKRIVLLCLEIPHEGSLSSLQGVVSPQLEGALLSSVASLYLISSNCTFTFACCILNKTTYSKTEISMIVAYSLYGTVVF